MPTWAKTEDGPILSGAPLRPDVGIFGEKPNPAWIRAGCRTLPETPIGCGKTAQLSTVVSSSASKAESGKQKALHKQDQKPAAWTSFPWTQDQLVQSADLCFQCNKLQWHTLHVGYLSTASAKKVRE